MAFLKQIHQGEIDTFLNRVFQVPHQAIDAKHEIIANQNNHLNMNSIRLPQGLGKA